MKLRTKVTVIAIVAASAALIVLSIVLFYTVSVTRLDAANLTAVSRSRILARDFEDEISRQWEQGVSDTVKESMVPYVFRKRAEAAAPGVSAILYKDGQPVQNNTRFTPNVLMEAGAIQAQDGVNHTTVRAAGQYLLITSEPVELDGEAYTVYLIEDVSPVYGDLSALILQFGLAGASVLAASAIIVYFLIKKALAPLTRLRKQAALVADGVYDKRINPKSHDEVGDLMNSFNKMSASVERNVDQLTAMAEQRRLLLAAMTHEIKTPMTSVVGYSETLMRVRLTEDEAKRAIERINTESKRLERLTQKLMSLIMLEEGGSLTLTDTPMRTVLLEVHATTAERFADMGVELKIGSDDSHHLVDVDLMVSMMRNFMDNAANAGATKLLVRAMGDVIEIQDNGKGIPPDELEHIMEPFYRVDKSRSKKSGGSGLGLAICQRIAEAHSADIVYDSVVGKGTTVRIVFVD